MKIPYLDYERYVYLIINLGIPRLNIYCNWNEEDKKNLQEKFDFYQSYLDSGSKHAKDDSHFYFSHDYSLGGGARKIGDNYFIKIYIGTFNRLHGLFAINETIFDSDRLEAVKEANLPINTDFPINVLMRDICLLFTYYHELAHLHQESKYLSIELHENHSSGVLDFERHVLEFDADIFSAIAVSTHIFQYFENWHYRKTIEDLEEITSILLAGILIRILLSPGIKVAFYTEETTHPHWIVRMSKIIEVVSDHTGNIVNRKYGIGLLNTENIIRKSLAYTKTLNEVLDLGVDLGDLGKMVVDNAGEIEAYEEKLMIGIEKLEKSAWKRWNEVSEILNN